MCKNLVKIGWEIKFRDVLAVVELGLIILLMMRMLIVKSVPVFILRENCAKEPVGIFLIPCFMHSNNGRL